MKKINSIFIALIPTSSIIPLAEVMNDHRMFFPFVGLMLSVCWAFGLLIINNEKTILKNSQDSINACNKALKIKPDYDLAYNNICAAYNELKMWDKAIAACEKGLSINPNNQLMKNNLARAKRGKASIGLK